MSITLRRGERRSFTNHDGARPRACIKKVTAHNHDNPETAQHIYTQRTPHSIYIPQGREHQRIWDWSFSLYTFRRKLHNNSNWIMGGARAYVVTCRCIYMM